MTDTEGAPGPRRRGIPLSVVVLATAAAVLATALVVSLLRDDDADANTRETLVLQPDGALGPDPLVDPGSDPSGQEAPDFTVVPLDGGPEQRFADFRDGRPVVVNFFASWCPPCIAEMPAFEEVWSEVGDEVAFLGIAVQDGAADATDLVERTGVTYPTAEDPDRDIVLAFEGLAMPTTAFVAADGTITSIHSGELTRDALTERIDRELR